MIQDIFLTYANHSLKDNPEILYGIFEEFTKSLHEVFLPDKISDIIKEFAIFVKCDDLKIADDEFRRKVRRVKSLWDKNCLKMAFNGVYGYRNGYCEEDCYKGLAKRDVLGKRRFRGPHRLKCYECEQLFFRHMLAEIADGKEYQDIAGGQLVHYLINAHTFIMVGADVVPASSDSLFKQDIKLAFSFAPRDIDEPYTSSFSRIFLDSMVVYSLIEFLRRTDRRLLKQCPYCHAFFEASRINQARCKSDDCRRAHERLKKRKQREQAPVKYY